jgi:hypothetical protein
MGRSTVPGDTPVMNRWLPHIAFVALVAVLAPLTVQSQESSSVQDVDNGAVIAQNGAKTQIADTEILYTVPPTPSYRTRLWSINYMPGATAHNLYAMIPIGSKYTTIAADAAVGATTLTTTATMSDAGGGAAAASDYVVVKYSDNTYEGMKISGVSGLTITVPALTKEVSAGNTIYFYGAIGDHALRKYVVTASARFSLSDNKVGLVTTTGNNQPILILSNNAAAAGVLDHVGAGPVRVVN